MSSGLWTQIPLPATCPDWTRFDGEFFPETGLVYLMGGRAGSDFIDTIYSFDPAAETCADTGQIMPIPVANYTIVLVNNGSTDLLCTMGGFTVGGLNTSAVQCYDPIENTIATVSSLPMPYGDFNPGGVAVVSNKVYIFGGFRNNAPPYNSAQTWEWDSITNEWVQMGDMSLGRGYINAAVVDGLIYAMGGDTFDGSSLHAQQTTEVFDPALGTWDDAAITDLPEATGEGRAYGFDSGSPYSLGGKILIAGGGQWSDRTNDVFTYDVASDTYDYLFADLNVPRRDHAGFFIPGEDGVLWVLGGRSDSDSQPFAPPEYYIVGSPPPDIEVNPLSLQTTQSPDIVTTQPITICNVGHLPLNWNLFEVPGSLSTGFTLDVVGSSELQSQVELGVEGYSNGGSNAPEGIVTLSLDDDSWETSWTFVGTDELILLNRFTPDPGDFPFQLDEVRIFHHLVPVGEEFTLALYENTTAGSDPAPGSNLRLAIPTTVLAVDEWNVYTLDPPLTFNGPGDVLIGIIPLGTSWNIVADTTINQQPPIRILGEPTSCSPLLPPDWVWELFDMGWEFLIRGCGETIGIDLPVEENQLWNTARIIVLPSM
jgi:hypothetical protein